MSTIAPNDPTRFWDGQQWLKWNGSAWGPEAGQVTTFVPSPKTGNVFGRHKVLTALGAVTLLIIGGSVAAAAGGSKAPVAANPAVSAASTPRIAPTPTPTSTPTPTTAAPVATVAAPVAPVVTISQASALQSAQSYIDMGNGFSWAGLVGQLDSTAGEGFSKADATWAVNHLAVDWNAQAVLSAKGYMAMGGFSRSGLIEQLSSTSGEQFTLAQAKFAAKAVGLG